MNHDLERLTLDWHQALPGIARAALIDHGLGSETIDRHWLGWNGAHFTVPVRNAAGRVVFVESWWPEKPGEPVTPEKSVLLFGAEILAANPYRVVIAEGILEALVLQSARLSAVSSTGSGRYFKRREWGPLLDKIPQVLVAFKNGPLTERRKWILDRDEVTEKILERLSQARRVSWPETVGRHGGAVEFFARGRGTKKELADFWAKP